MAVILRYQRSTATGHEPYLECLNPQPSLSLDGLHKQLDDLARLSAEAQNLKVPITSYEKMLTADGSQVLLVLVEVDSAQVLGYLKYGYKASLYFYMPRTGRVVQKDRTLCLLDFYVLEAHQRRGFGKMLFEAFLKDTEVLPEMIAYDRPSPKLLPFLSKNFALTGADLQPNRFAVFPPFLSSL
eukprot:gene6719-7428_t